MKGSEWAFRIRPSGKNGCLKSTSGGNQFRYDQRTVPSGERFERIGFTNQLMLTHLINEHWKAYLKWNREEDQSNSRTTNTFKFLFDRNILGPIKSGHKLKPQEHRR